jgi:D-glycero-D-manno-heptose 1,7-bisphosphate phosphatase
LIIQLYSKIQSISKILFLDRDNTLVFDNGYFNDPNKIVFIEENLSIFKILNDNKIGLILISNQSSIGRDMHKIDTVMSVNKNIKKKIESVGGKLLSAIFCPHLPLDECFCRKPSPDMLLVAINLFNAQKIECLFIGDKRSDELSANAAGISFKYAKGTGYSDLILEWVLNDNY